MQTLDGLRAGDYAGTQSLRLSCGLTTFPEEIFDLADTLEVLDLSGNALSSLPEDLPRLSRLRIIFCSNNAFTELPPVLGQCSELSMIGFKSNRIRTVSAQALPPKLRWLILTDNAVTELPETIGKCGQLQKLMLAGNQLSQLPDSLSACNRLELLRIAANRLTALPDWLLHMPRLSWLAFAGNPFSVDRDSDAPGIAWQDIDLHEVLGEGASGTIYRATDRRASEPRTVAVKLFKGAVTSDGLPHCEMNACLQAGSHLNLIPVLGRVTDQPEGRDALVMEIVDSGFANLAGPPSLQSCTRDIYAEESRFDLNEVLMIARGMASVGRHLHERGLMHGDLYAHNILYDPRRGVLTGDFGAASFYESNRLAALQKLEVRAFGCLLEELLQRCESISGLVMDGLIRLRDACLTEHVPSRPLFADIEAQLAEIAQAG